MTPSSPLSFPGRWKLHSKSHFLEVTNTRNYSSRLNTLARNQKQLKPKKFHISIAFRLDFNTASIHMLSGWKPTDSLFSLRADSTGFQAPPPFKRPPQQNAGRLETDDASQPIRAFVFLPESILIGFYILWKENVLE